MGAGGGRPPSKHSPSPDSQADKQPREDADAVLPASRLEGRLPTGRPVVNPACRLCKISTEDFAMAAKTLQNVLLALGAAADAEDAPSQAPATLTKKQLAERISVSVQALDAMRRRGRIPREVRPGGPTAHPRWRAAD